MGETLIAVPGLIALALAGLLLADLLAPEFPADSAADRRRRGWRGWMCRRRRSWHCWAPGIRNG